MQSKISSFALHLFEADHRKEHVVPPRAYMCVTINFATHQEPRSFINFHQAHCTAHERLYAPGFHILASFDLVASLQTAGLCLQRSHFSTRIRRTQRVVGCARLLMRRRRKISSPGFQVVRSTTSHTSAVRLCPRDRIGGQSAHDPGWQDGRNTRTRPIGSDKDRTTTILRAPGRRGPRLPANSD